MTAVALRVVDVELIHQTSNLATILSSAMSL